MFNFALSLNQHYANSTLSQIGITISHQHIASRFEAEDNIDKLPEYGITSINAMGKVNIENTHLTAKFDVLNLFNEQYQVLLGYPMPGRSYRLSFAYELQ